MKSKHQPGAPRASISMGAWRVCSGWIRAALASAILGAGALSVPAQLIISRAFTVNENIPDGGELLNVQSSASSGFNIAELSVTFEISGPQAFNGDYYATVGHSLADGSDAGFAVLLNRPGRREDSAFGYSDNGMTVTFSDAAAGDIHNYREELSGSHETPLGGPLTGEWQPDARTTDPGEVLATDARTAFLSGFDDFEAGGQWRVFVADMSGGGEGTLVSWGTRIHALLEAGARLVFDGDTVETFGGAQSLDHAVTLNGVVSFVGSDRLELQGEISGDGQLVKRESGALVLSAPNSYSGGTIVEGGSLFANNTSGSGTGTGSVTVRSGGLLGGNGTISGPVTLRDGGTISPGINSGTLTFTGSQTWGPGGSYLWEINDAGGSDGEVGQDPGWDWIEVLSHLDITAISGASGDMFILKISSLTLENAAGPVHDFDPSQNYLWTIATATDGISGFDPSKFLLDIGDFSNDLNGGSFGLLQSENDLMVSFTAVPEPEHYALAMGVGILGWALLRKRSKRRQPDASGLNRPS